MNVMDTLFLKITIDKTNKEAEAIRNEGLLFANIADAIGVNRDAIVEIDESNYEKMIEQIYQTYNN
jgi:DNA-binding XRE family transcriptional regulator